MTEHFGNNRRFRLLCLALVLGSVIAYAPLLHSGFTNYDDPEYVTENPHVRSGLSLENIRWSLASSHSANWHPLTWMSHMLDCQLYGLKPFGHHLTNLLFHVANTLVLFALLRRTTGALWRSALVAAVFAWHPLHVESVAWISERKDVLSTFFWLLTLWAYARYTEESKVQSPTSKVFYALALLLFALGLTAKPMVVTLPFTLLLLDYWPLCRLAGTVRSAVPVAEESIKRQNEPPETTAARFTPLLLEKIPFFLLSAASSIITFLVQKHGGAVVTTGTLSITSRINNALISYCRYLGKTFWPTNLSVFYPRPDHWPAGIVIVAAMGLLGFSILVLALRRQRPWLPVGWFWYLGTLVPVIGLVQVGDQSMADRYTYIPMIGVLMMLAWSLPDLSGKGRVERLAVPMLPALLAIVCIALTWHQAGYWQNTGTLFRHAGKAAPDNYVACWHLADDDAARANVPGALEMYRRTLELAPTCFQARNNLGKLLLDQGHLPEAVDQFQKVLALKPDHPRAHNNLGIALSRQGHADEAIREFNEALRLNPDYAEAHNNLGTALLRSGRANEAIAEFQAGTALDPTDADAQFNLGVALEGQGRLDEAIARFQQAVQLQPTQADAHNSLGAALGRKGLPDAAIAQFQEAIRLDPNSAEAHCNLGIMLAAKGNRGEAITHLTRALALQPGYPEAAQRLQSLTNAP